MKKLLTLSIPWSENSHIGKGKTFLSLDDFNRAIRTAQLFAPARGRGYDKTAFSLRWDNGFVYSGRLDLQTDSPSVRQHIYDFVKYIRSDNKDLLRGLPEGFPEEYEL